MKKKTPRGTGSERREALLTMLYWRFESIYLWDEKKMTLNTCVHIMNQFIFIMQQIIYILIMKQSEIHIEEYK